ncbi:CocE/NonD family hydrolase [Streptomyces adustus]|uniref:CocE/NonD family hydrolase n=1 Tax=Streptomyces adustus TaxID=1609272 RepID=UPI003712B2B0
MLNVTHVGPGPLPQDARQVMVPMRDGVLLAADLYTVDADRADAVILVRLPYDKDGAYCFMPEVSRYFTAHGYHVLVQDVRGKYRSEGVTEFARHEPDDGYDTIQWITEQPWCDGSVVMWGDSYYGYTTIAAAISGHPALKAISPRVTGSQLAMTLQYGDGTGDVEQTTRKGYFATHYVDADHYEWEPDWSVRPLRDALEPFFDQLGKRSANFDAEFTGKSPFVPRPVRDLAGSTPVPALYTIGWFDNCAIWSWTDVRALQRTPAWAEHLYLRLEAVDHENYWLGHAPVGPEHDHSTDPAAREEMLPRYLDPSIEFFNAILGRCTDLPPRVRYEVCHGDWRTSTTWPPPKATQYEYHLAPDSLSTKPPAEESRLAWTHDPSDLVPSAGANPFAMLFDRSDLAPVGKRDDVLRFAAAAAEEETDLVGAVTLTLRLKAPEGATVHARLLDLNPDGEAYLITYGQARLGPETKGGLTVVDLQSVAYRLRAGHRVALDVMSSNFPDYVPEAAPGTDPWTTLPGQPVTRELFTGGPTAASCLRIGSASIDSLRRTGITAP